MKRLKEHPQSYTNASGTRRFNLSSTGELWHPHALLLHQATADLNTNRSHMQATYEWRSCVAVTLYNKGKARMDTPHLRSQAPPSDWGFYPHIMIQPRCLLHAAILLGLFGPEDRGDIFLRNIDRFFKGLHDVISQNIRTLQCLQQLVTGLYSKTG
jgi:hypothetical protein